MKLLYLSEDNNYILKIRDEDYEKLREMELGGVIHKIVPLLNSVGVYHALVPLNHFQSIPDDLVKGPVSELEEL